MPRGVGSRGIGSGQWGVEGLACLQESVAHLCGQALTEAAAASASVAAAAETETEITMENSWANNKAFT